MTVSTVGRAARHLIYRWWEYKMVEPLRRIVGNFLQGLPYVYHITAITFLRIYSREMKAYVLTKTRTQMFVVLLLMATKN